MSNEELISSVRPVLEASARKGKLVNFSEIEERIGKNIGGGWDKVLDPIYEELRALGKPDLTAIVVYKDGDRKGYPPWFSEGGEPRSKRFNQITFARLNAGKRKLLSFSQLGAINKIRQ